MHLDDCLIIDRRRSTIIFAGEFRFRDSFHLPLSSASSFEFGEDAQHIQKSLAGWRRHIDGLARASKCCTLVLELPNNSLKVKNAAGEPVDACDDEGVAFRDKIEQDLQLVAAFELRALYSLRESFGNLPQSALHAGS